jgi:hypothetical protein
MSTYGRSLTFPFEDFIAMGLVDIVYWPLDGARSLSCGAVEAPRGFHTLVFDQNLL